MEHERLQALLDEQLNSDEQERLSEHVENCEYCQDCLEKLTQASDSRVLDWLHDSACLQNDTGARSFLAVQERLSRRLAHHFCRGHAKNRELADLPNGFMVSDYRILKTIGRGGMGTVYLAEHVQLGRQVAIKILPDSWRDDPQRIARFQREAKAIGQLTHPNIVTAYDAGEAAGRYFLVMEYVHGIDLTQLTKGPNCLTTADACEIIRQAANGLQHIFQAGLIHRDLKPSNIMIRQLAGEAEVKILDLGLANFVGPFQPRDSLTQSGQVMGTIDYMAPEQFGGRPIDIRADIYSLGVTLYELLSGTSPLSCGVPTNNLLEKLKSRSTQSILPLRERRPDLPVELGQFVDRMLQTDVSNRPTTPREVADEMQKFAVNHQLGKLNLQPPVHADSETVALAKKVSTASHWNRRQVRFSSKSQQSGKQVGGIAGIGIRWLIGLATVLTMVLAVVIVLHQTDGGQIAVSSSDPDLKIEVVRNATDVKEFEVKQLTQQTWFRSGEYEIRLPREVDDRRHSPESTFPADGCRHGPLFRDRVETTAWSCDRGTRR